MGFTVVLSDAAMQYGIHDQSAALGAGLAAIIGTQSTAVASWGSGTLAGGQSGTISIGYSHGFSIVLHITQVNSTTAQLTQASLHASTGTQLLSYTGSLTVTAATLLQNFSDTIALASNDVLTGNSGDNILQGYDGADTVDGGGGIDTFILDGSRSSYTVTNTNGALRLAGPDGSDRLTNVERLQFDDLALAFDTSGQAGQVYRLYQAALDRAPEAGGLGFYIDVLEDGWGLRDIAGNFLRSPEFISNYGANPTDLQFVQQLYLNVLHRPGEAAGIQYHLNDLALGTARELLLINFSESPENQGQLIGVMSLGMAYIPV